MRSAPCASSRAQAGIDPTRVASIGFSAGGHVAASLATRFDWPLAPDGDASNSKPDISCFMYPVITMGEAGHAGSRSYLLGANPSAENLARYSLENHARTDMSPTMVIHAADDEAVPLANGLAIYDAIRRANVRSELHVFEEGGHGFGLRFVRDKARRHLAPVVFQLGPAPRDFRLGLTPGATLHVAEEIAIRRHHDRRALIQRVIVRAHRAIRTPRIPDLGHRRLRRYAHVRLRLHRADVRFPAAPSPG